MSQDARSSGNIFIVDDEPAIRSILEISFKNDGYDVLCFAEGVSLLAAAKLRSPACILLDVHIPGRSGIAILKELNAQDYPAPIIIMSGRGDIATAVDAIKSGALDFIEKPFRGSDVVARVRRIMDVKNSRRARADAASPSMFYFPGRKPLTGREQEVLASLVNGASNKNIAKILGISHRTIEGHRASIMAKLGAKNATDLIRIVMSERGAR